MPISTGYDEWLQRPYYENDGDEEVTQEELDEQEAIRQEIAEARMDEARMRRAFGMGDDD